MRVIAYVVVGALALVTLHAIAFYFYHPRVTPDAPLTIERAPAVAGEATVLFAGDTLLGDAAAATIAEHGFEWPLSLTVELVRDADLAVVNAEGPITDGGTEFPVYKDYLYRAPARAAAALAWAGFDVLELANNHATDWGEDGLLDTLANARAQHTIVIGAGRDAADARRGAIARIGDVRVGLLDFCEEQILWKLYVDQFARARHPGVVELTADNLRDDVARLRPLVDVLIVSLHIGEGYRPPEAQALAWSRRAIDAGADLVVNHHPHVAHPVAMHRGRPILLSIGNYAFGTPGRFGVAVAHAFDFGLLARARIASRRLDRVELIPLAVDNRVVAFRPAPLDGDARDAALAALARESAAYGADVRVSAGRGVVYAQPAWSPPGSSTSAGSR
jgi:Bacterial capsule synthesis protein PGA_cap